MHRVASAFKANNVPLVGRVSVEKVTAVLEYVMRSYILEALSGGLMEGSKRASTCL